MRILEANRDMCGGRVGTYLAALLLAAYPCFADVHAKDFDTPDAAVAALAEAIRSNHPSPLRSILGPGSGKLVHSGDAVEDALGRQKFIAAYDQAHKLVYKGDSVAELQIGSGAWPFPIPVVKSANARWHFTAASGAKEILARRIGRNELSAMQVCLAIMDAEREYALQHANTAGVGEYTRRFSSSPGTHDGLYWPQTTGETPSPLGPLLAKASVEGYADVKPGRRVAYHGYFYKILTAQGASAAGGAYDYAVNGRLIGGVAVMAYPARYGASGVMSFMVDQNHTVYEKDMGRHSEWVTRQTRLFNPDASWKEVSAVPQ